MITKRWVRPARLPFLLPLLAILITVAGMAWPQPVNAQTTDLPVQTPADITYGYHEQMTPEEVEAECRRIDGVIDAEADRLADSIKPYESSHPGYYATETGKITAWQTEAETAAETECQQQKQAAANRQPPIQTPDQIVYGYHDEMTEEEVETECERIYGLIDTEADRMLTNIAPYENSHPDYYATEAGKITAWQAEAETVAEAECQRQKQAAEERRLAGDIDDLYPEISPEIKQLANRIGLTNRAKRILYNNNPLILDDPNHPDFTCGGDTFADTYIHGCWDHSGPIKLLRDNSIETTLAHELLHVIYYREYYLVNANKGIDEQIDIVVARNPRQTSIILDAYADQINSLPDRTGRYIRYTELYAFTGTQFTDSTPDLEDHYAKYFRDRQALVDIFHDWAVGTRAKIMEQETYNTQLVNQANEYLACLNDVNRTTGDCLAYYPDKSRYAAYDDCLASRKTFVADCQHLKPAAFIAYVPAPVPIAPPAPVDNGELQALIEETEELVAEVQEEQEEIEDSFIHQLVFYDHEMDEAEETADQTAVTNQPAGTDELEDENEFEEEVAEEEAEPAADAEEEEERSEDSPSGQRPDQPTTDTPWGWLIVALVLSGSLIGGALFFNLRRRVDKPEPNEEEDEDNEAGKNAGRKQR